MEPPSQPDGGGQPIDEAAAPTAIPIRALPLPPALIAPARPPVPARKPSPPPSRQPPQPTSTPNPFDDSATPPATNVTRRRRLPLPHSSSNHHHGGGGPPPVILGWTQAPRNPFDETVTLESPVTTAAAAAGPVVGTATISPALLRKQRSVMPVDIYEPPIVIESGAAQQQQGVGESSPRPYDDDEERVGGGGKRRTSSRSARVVGEEEDGRPESVDPALARSYDARQIGFHIARTYRRLYSPEQRKLLMWEYQDILKRHGQNTTVRRMHRQIVLDVLASSDTSLLTILFNGLCPLAIRPLLTCLCCGWRLEPNYWQKNLDDEITFYALQFLAFSILPIFPTLLDACVALLSPLRWEIRQPSCREAHPYTVTGQWDPVNDPTNPSLGFIYNSTTSCASLHQGRDAVAQGREVEAGNAMGGGIYYTDPVLHDSMAGTCQLSEAIEGRTTPPQVGVLLIYLAFILWALYELYVKLRELEYMKIANHLRAVYVPNMVNPTHHDHDHHPTPQDKNHHTPRPWWWGPWGRKPKPQSPSETPEDEQPAASGAGGNSKPRRARARRPSIDDIHPSTIPSYPRRQFPEAFLLLLTSLLALCLVALWRGANEDSECLVAPAFVVDEGMRLWLARAYDAWAQRAARSSAGRGGTRMCYGVWRCPPLDASQTLFPFIIQYKQTRVSTLLQVVVETGIFAATAYKLLTLLRRSYFFIDVERYMDPAYEPPYKGIHEHRARIMTRAMVEDYICLRREMFVDTVKTNLPYLFDRRQLHNRPFSPRYVGGLTPDIA